MPKSFSPLKPERITVRSSGRTPISSLDAEVLSNRGITIRDAFPRSPFHHLIPQELLKYEKIRRALEQAHIDIHEYAVQLSEGDHSAIHTMGYNEKWISYFENHENPSREMILAQMYQMKFDFKISEHIQQYVKLA